MPYNFNQNLHTYGGRASHSHIPDIPAWFGIIRIIQAFFALLTLALSAFCIDRLGSWSGFGMNIFTSIFTFLYLAYIFVTAFKLHHGYNYIAVLVLEALLFIFWLTTFALLAELASAFGDRGWGGRRVYGEYQSAVDAEKAATAFAALTWVSFGVTLAFYSKFPKRSRRGGESKANETSPGCR